MLVCGGNGRVYQNFLLHPIAIKLQSRHGLETKDEEWSGEDTGHSRQEDRAGAGADNCYKSVLDGIDIHDASLTKTN